MQWYRRWRLWWACRSLTLVAVESPAGGRINYRLMLQYGWGRQGRLFEVRGRGGGNWHADYYRCPKFLLRPAQGLADELIRPLQQWVPLDEAVQRRIEEQLMEWRGE